jgi:hypothetical protein
LTAELDHPARAMTIYFIQTEPTSEDRFRDQLREHDLYFVGTAADVGEDAEMLVIRAMPARTSRPSLRKCSATKADVRVS